MKNFPFDSIVGSVVIILQSRKTLIIIISIYNNQSIISKISNNINQSKINILKIPIIIRFDFDHFPSKKKKIDD